MIFNYNNQTTKQKSLFFFAIDLYFDDWCDFLGGRNSPVSVNGRTSKTIFKFRQATGAMTRLHPNDITDKQAGRRGDSRR